MLQMPQGGAMKKTVWLVLRKQFDVIGLTVENGWSDERVLHFIKSDPNWYNKHSWTRKQGDEWRRFCAKTYRIPLVEVNWIDMNHGWAEKESTGNQPYTNISTPVLPAAKAANKNAGGKN
jgi:hypothetical protein